MWIEEDIISLLLLTNIRGKSLFVHNLKDLCRHHARKQILMYHRCTFSRMTWMFEEKCLANTDHVLKHLFASAYLITLITLLKVFFSVHVILPNIDNHVFYGVTVVQHPGGHDSLGTFDEHDHIEPFPEGGIDLFE